MAKNRLISSDFWVDEWIESLEPLERYLFLYLMTNDQVHISGVYKTTIRRIKSDTGLTPERIEKVLQGFEVAGKAFFVDGYIIIKNFLRYQKPNANMKTGIENSLKNFPDSVKAFLYKLNQENHLFMKAFQSLIIGFERINNNISNNIDLENKNGTPENPVEPGAEKKNGIPYKNIILACNAVLGKNWKPGGAKIRELIKARWNEGHREKDFETVCIKKKKDWQGGLYEQYLRPETLFGNKFDGYLNQSGGGAQNPSPQISAAKLDTDWDNKDWLGD